MNLYIPVNKDIEESDCYLSNKEFVALLRKYKKYPEKIQFLADMMEE